MRILFYLVSLSLLASSCVTNKKFTLLQRDDVNKRGLVLDSVVRTYPYQNFEYKIQPEDILSVRFESLTPKEYDFFASDATQNLNFTVGANALVMGELVDQDGNIPLPVVGKVKVAGLNIFEIQEKLQALASQYMESPVVKVRLINFRFTIAGEVLQEGTIFLNNNRVNMMEAIGLAGGMTDLADKANIKLVRQVNGKTEIIYLNLLSEEFLSSPYYFVHQNDLLIVPPLKQRPYRKYFGQNFSLFLSTVSIALLVVNLSR